MDEFPLLWFGVGPFEGLTAMDAVALDPKRQALTDGFGRPDAACSSSRLGRFRCPTKTHPLLDDNRTINVLYRYIYSDSFPALSIASLLSCVRGVSWRMPRFGSGLPGGVFDDVEATSRDGRRRSTNARWSDLASSSSPLTLRSIGFVFSVAIGLMLMTTGTLFFVNVHLLHVPRETGSESKSLKEKDGQLAFHKAMNASVDDVARTTQAVLIAPGG